MYKINLWNEKIPFHNLLKMYVDVHACSYNLTFWQVALMRLLPFYKYSFMAITCTGRKISWDHLVITYHIVLNTVYLHVSDDTAGTGKWRKFLCMHIYLCNSTTDLKTIWSKLIVCLNSHYINSHWGVGCL